MTGVRVRDHQLGSRLMVILALALLTACGGGETDRAETLDPPRPSDTSTTDASDSDGSGDVGADGALSKSELEAALLTLQEMPTGFTLDDSGDDSENTSDDECGRRYEDLSDAGKANVAAKADRDFTKGGGFSTVFASQTLIAYVDEESATERLDSLSALMQECQEFEFEDDGEQYSMQLKPLSFPNMGDRTIAVTVTAASSAVTVDLYLVHTLLGQHGQSIATGGIGGADIELTERMARDGLTKFESALDAA